jgi:hypothetical protein
MLGRVLHVVTGTVDEEGHDADVVVWGKGLSHVFAGRSVHTPAGIEMYRAGGVGESFPGGVSLTGLDIEK